MLLDEAITKYRESLEISGRSPATLHTNSITLNYFNKYLQSKYNSMVYLDEVTTRDIEDFFKYLKHERNNTSNTIETHSRKIKAFFNYAIKYGCIQINPILPIPKIRYIHKPRLYLTYQEVEKIVSVIASPMLKVYFTTLYFTGLRLSESLKLKLEDVDLENNMINLNYGKGGKSRVIPISDKLKTILMGYIQNIRPDVEGTHFFSTKQTGKLSERYVWHTLKEALKILNWEERGITTHTFRHSFAGNLVKKKVNIRAVQKLLGHYDISVTAIYLNAETGELREAVNEL